MTRCAANFKNARRRAKSARFRLTDGGKFAWTLVQKNSAVAQQTRRPFFRKQARKKGEA
jgi:hypothetical protein